MKAVVITSYGGVEGIGVQELDTPPVPTADRVRVRVHAAGLNRADILQRRGHYPAPPGYPTNIPGLEFAGEVESIGQEVRTWKIGDRVFGITAGGAQAEFVSVPDSNLARIPAELDWVQAGAMPEVFITAHDALFTRANLHLGERVLIHAAASGVGTAAIQVAHAAGATVYGTSRTADKLERLHGLNLGLDQSVAVGGEPANFVEAVQKWTNGAGVDVILDLVGGNYFAPNLEALASRGRSTSGCSCENGRRLSARCFAGARSKKRRRQRGALPLPFSRWCHAARFVRSSIAFTRQAKSATRMHVWNPTPASAKSY